LMNHLRRSFCVLKNIGVLSGGMVTANIR